MSVVLVGYRGSGKTTVGRKLADRLWLKFVDTDDLITSRAGKSIKEIFEHDGEANFRELELAAVREALTKSDHVIALGGGAIVRAETRSLLKQAGRKVVYLRCDPKMLLQRIQADPQTTNARPNLTEPGGGIEEIRSLLATR